MSVITCFTVLDTGAVHHSVCDNMLYSCRHTGPETVSDYYSPPLSPGVVITCFTVLDTGAVHRGVCDNMLYSSRHRGCPPQNRDNMLYRIDTGAVHHTVCDNMLYSVRHRGCPPQCL